MTDGVVLLEKAPPLARVILNRPGVINAINIEIRDALFDLMPALALDPEVEAVVFAGQGRAFSSGADVREFGTAPSVVLAKQVRWLRDIWGLLIDFPKLTVAAIHGFAIGAGVELALCLDLRVASVETVFAVPETAFAMIPGAGGSQTLPRAVGVGRTLDLILTGRRINAEQALAWGLVDRVVPAGEHLAAAEALAREVLRVGPDLVRRAKAAVNIGLNLPLQFGLLLERALGG